MTESEPGRALRILTANDDGAVAPGLALLADVARPLGAVVGVGPARKWTAASHQVSFDRDITLRKCGEHRYECSGSPVDGLMVALATLYAEGDAPDLVLAGINDKRNVGEDLAYSGTLAIAREATMRGVPAIALSRDDWPADASADEAEVGTLLRLLWSERATWLAPGAWLSVNLPARLPAPLRQATLARDKIASAADVTERTHERIVFRLRRGRPGGAREGDENALLALGAVVVVRHRWDAAAPLPEALVGAWSATFASGAAPPGLEAPGEST